MGFRYPLQLEVLPIIGWDLVSRSPFPNRLILFCQLSVAAWIASKPDDRTERSVQAVLTSLRNRCRSRPSDFSSPVFVFALNFFLVRYPELVSARCFGVLQQFVQEFGEFAALIPPILLEFLRAAVGVRRVRPSRELLGAVAAVFDDSVSEAAAADVLTLLADGDLVLDCDCFGAIARIVDGFPLRTFAPFAVDLANRLTAMPPRARGRRRPANAFPSTWPFPTPWTTGRSSSRSRRARSSN
jgi:hypothetical protein